MDHDRTLIGRLVEREVESRMSWAKFATVSGVSRATLYRVKDADPVVTERILRRIERGLGLPFDSLVTVGAHDFDQLEAMGMDAGLVEWLRRVATTDDADDELMDGLPARKREEVEAMRAQERERERRPNGLGEDDERPSSAL